MADSTIDSEYIQLFDLWPGVPEGRVPPYDDFVSTAAGHNCASEVYPKGTKVQVWCDGSVGRQGWATFIYLKFVANAGVALAAKQVVVPDAATDLYTVTNDPDDCLINTGGIGAVAISTLTTLYYGWFWCAGVCPEQYVSALGGNYATNAGVAVGSITYHDLDADAMGFDVTAGIEIPCGHSLAADA